MDLREFISTAIVQIVAGVVDAQAKIDGHGARVGSGAVYGGGNAARDEQDRRWHEVEFDVMLTEATGADAKGGIGVFLGSVGIGAQGGSHEKSETHSRVKFTVPIVYPGTVVKKPDRPLRPFQPDHQGII